MAFPRHADAVAADNELLEHVAVLVGLLRARNETRLSVAIGTPANPIMLILAVDSSASRLREAATEYLGWQCARWAGTPA